MKLIRICACLNFIFLSVQTFIHLYTDEVCFWAASMICGYFYWIWSIDYEPKKVKGKDAEI